MKKIKKTITHEIPINVTVTYHLLRSVNDTEVKSAQRQERRFDQFEERSRKLSEVKNKLEALVYKVREIQDSKEYITASTEEERELILKTANEHGEYLESDEAYVAKFKDFNMKLTQLQNLYLNIYIYN
jgi:hypoxia up-regulated 1